MVEKRMAIKKICSDVVAFFSTVITQKKPSGFDTKLQFVLSIKKGRVRSVPGSRLHCYRKAVTCSSLGRRASAVPKLQWWIDEHGSLERPSFNGDDTNNPPFPKMP